MTSWNPMGTMERLLPRSSAIILAAVVLPRLFWFFFLGGQLPMPTRDQALYIHTAGQIVSGEGFSFSGELGLAKNLRNTGDNAQRVWTEDPEYMFGLAPVNTPTAVMEPGYPVLLAVFFRVFGAVTGSVFALNMIFSVAGAFALRRLAAEAWGPLSGFMAAVLWALYPPYVYYSAYAMTETAHFALLMISLMFLFSAGRGKGTGMMAGISLGAFFLIRATSIFLLPLEMLYLALRKRWKQFAFISLGFALAVSPWVIRNAAVLGSPVLMPTKGALNLWMRNNPDVLALEGIHVPQDIPVNSPELLAYPSTDSLPGELERSAALGTAARKYMFANPRLMLWLSGTRALEFLGPGGSTLGGRGRIAGLLSTSDALRRLGLWRNRGRRETRFLVAVFILYLLLHAGAHGGVRYRLPVDAVFLAGIAMCGRCRGGDSCGA